MPSRVSGSWRAGNPLYVRWTVRFSLTPFVPPLSVFIAAVEKGRTKTDRDEIPWRRSLPAPFFHGDSDVASPRLSEPDLDFCLHEGIIRRKNVTIAMGAVLGSSRSRILWDKWTFMDLFAVTNGQANGSTESSKCDWSREFVAAWWIKYYPRYYTFHLRKKDVLRFDTEMKRMR